MLLNALRPFSSSLSAISFRRTRCGGSKTFIGWAAGAWVSVLFVYDFGSIEMHALSFARFYSPILIPSRLSHSHRVHVEMLDVDSFKTNLLAYEWLCDRSTFRQI